MPLTVVSIISLLFIPLFQYCHDAATDPDEENHTVLLLTLVWSNFIISWVFLLELISKIYAFGIRRAWSKATWAVKLEFFY